MEENRNEIIVNEDGSVEDGGEKLTATEKLILGGTCIGIGAAGYLLGTYVIAPIVKKLKAKAAWKTWEKANKKRSKVANESETVQDGDWREVDDEEEED